MYKKSQGWGREGWDEGIHYVTIIVKIMNIIKRISYLSQIVLMTVEKSCSLAPISFYGNSNSKIRPIYD